MSTPPASFVHDAPPPRVLFGVGRFNELLPEVGRLGAERVLLIATPSARTAADAGANVLAGRVVARIDEVAMHVPEKVAESAVAKAEAADAELVVCIGGGSSIGLAKVLALRLGTPYVAVPTTYAGSEMTPIWGRTRSGKKVTGRDDTVLPRTVIYDPGLTVSLPPRQSAASGMNALGHALEALYAPDATPETDQLATKGISFLVGALPDVVASPDDLSARSTALQGAWLCGRALGATQMGLHHAICHVVGGRFNLPHSATHSAVLPHVIAWNEISAADELAKCSGSLGTSPGDALWTLAKGLGAPMSLAELGLAPAHLDEVIDTVLASGPPNPQELTRAGVSLVLRSALAGDRPDRSPRLG